MKPSEETIGVPSEEQFKPDNGFVGGSRGMNADGSSRQDMVRLYNADGSMWYEFSQFNKKSPKYHLSNLNPEYKPFSSGINTGLVLRLKSVSASWFEVVVNEDTGLTKYTFINDPCLKYEKWEDSIIPRDSIVFDAVKNPFREAPNGKEKSDVALENPGYVFLGIEGDWMLVRVFNGSETGWIKWREGSNILIGFLLNKWTVPKAINSR